MPTQRRSSILQLFLEPLHLLLQLPKQRILRVLVNLGFVLYVLGTVRIPQSANCLVIVIVGRTEVRYL